MKGVGLQVQLPDNKALDDVSKVNLYHAKDPYISLTLFYRTVDEKS